MKVAAEGYVPVPGGMVWYQMTGGGDGVPLLVLHGGPGAGGRYLERLAELGTERPVIFYDQLGCGRSEEAAQSALRMKRFVAEITAVRRMLGLTRVHLFGHSWGGWLAIEYLLGGARGVVSAHLASTSSSLPQQMRELAALRRALPPDVAEALDRHEREGDLDHPDYRAALMEFYRRHLCRLEVWPPELSEVMTGLSASTAYTSLLGPNELIVTGTMRDWDRTADLPRIDVPTLVTVGHHDEITPACAKTLHRGIPCSRLKVFEDSSHMAHLEEPAHFTEVTREFLRACDSMPGRETRMFQTHGEVP